MRGRGLLLTARGLVVCGGSALALGVGLDVAAHAGMAGSSGEGVKYAGHVIALAGMVTALGGVLARAARP